MSLRYITWPGGMDMDEEKARGARINARGARLAEAVLSEAGKAQNLEERVSVLEKAVAKLYEVLL